MIDVSRWENERLRLRKWRDGDPTEFVRINTPAGWMARRGRSDGYTAR